MHWQIDADRRLGTSHAERSLPCQDNIFHASTRNWHTICISDGAGSSKLSEISSKFVSERFAQSLLGLADLIEARGPGSWINDHIIQEVLDLRAELKDHTNSTELDDYHCTLVAILVNQNVAIAVHIGDGAIIAGKSEASSESSSLLNSALTASLPENGDYKNETFFVTESHWLKHLRIKVLGKIDWFVMGSDGGIDILTDRQKIDGPLIADLLNYISIGNNKVNAVSQLIDSEFADGKTTDDISLVVGWLRSTAPQRQLIWDDSPSKSLYLDPATDPDNLQPNTILATATAAPIPKARLESKIFSFIFNLVCRRSTAKLLAILVFSVVLFSSAYIYLTGRFDSAPAEISEHDLNQQVEEQSPNSSVSSNSAAIAPPTENENFGDEGQSLETPNDFQEKKGESPDSFFERILKSWSLIFGGAEADEPKIQETAPKAVEQIEL